MRHKSVDGLLSHGVLDYPLSDSKIGYNDTENGTDFSVSADLWPTCGVAIGGMRVRYVYVTVPGTFCHKVLQLGLFAHDCKYYRHLLGCFAAAQED